MQVTASVFPHYPGEGIRYTKHVSMPDKALPCTEQEALQRSYAAIKHLWPDAAHNLPPAYEAFIGNGFCLCKAHGYEVWWKTDTWIASTDRMYQTGRFMPESFPRSES